MIDGINSKNCSIGEIHGPTKIELSSIFVINENKKVAGPSAALTAVLIKVSPFGDELDVQFALAGVITGATKFNHALVGLDEESVALVASVLSGFSYGRLKD